MPTPTVAELGNWVRLVGDSLTIIGGLLAALWAYTKYVVERGLLAPAQSDIDCANVGAHKGMSVIEVLLRIKNLGSATLVIQNVKVSIRYLLEQDDVCLSEKKFLGRLFFPHALQEQIAVTPDEPRPTSGAFQVVTHDTFVQPQVEQLYTFVSAVPRGAKFVFVRSSFEYAQRANRIQRLSFRLSRRLGLIQYSLDHVRKPHTAERVFRIARADPAPHEHGSDS